MDLDVAWSGFAVLLFAAVICLCEGAWLWWSSQHGNGARRIALRLRLMSGRTDPAGARISILKERRYADTPALERLLQRVPRIAALDRLLLQAGLRWQVARFLALQGLALLAAWLAPRLRTARAQRMINVLVGLVMWFIALQLAKDGFQHVQALFYQA